MKKKKKQIIELSDKKDEEEKREKSTNNKMEDDLKVNKIKKEIQSIDGFLAGSGNCRSQFLLMHDQKKELNMLLRLLKSFGMKEIIAVVNAYPCDMARKPNSILFHMGREIAISKVSQTELRLCLVQIPSALDE